MILEDVTALSHFGYKLFYAVTISISIVFFYFSIKNDTEESKKEMRNAAVRLSCLFHETDELPFIIISALVYPFLLCV